MNNYDYGQSYGRNKTMIKGTEVTVLVSCPWESWRQTFQRPPDSRTPMRDFAVEAQRLAESDHIEYHERRSRNGNRSV